MYSDISTHHEPAHSCFVLHWSAGLQQTVWRCGRLSTGLVSLCWVELGPFAPPPPPPMLPVGWGVLVGVGGCLRSPLDGVESGVLCTSLKVRECLRGGGWGSLRSPEGQGVFEGWRCFCFCFCTPLKVRECLRGGGWGSLYSPSRSGSVDGVRGRGWGSLHSPEGQGVFEGWRVVFFAFPWRWVMINSLVCWFCTSTLCLFLFQGVVCLYIYNIEPC